MGAADARRYAASRLAEPLGEGDGLQKLRQACVAKVTYFF
jgi:hypothetical protein